MVPGRAGTMTHDYKRNGTTDLFAAMNIATGQVLTHCQKGHTAKDVLRYFKQIDATVPRGLAVHVVLANLSAHKTPEITKWLAHRDRRRWHLHFTATSSSWLNLVERWFKELADRRLRRGMFTSVPELQDAIVTWAGHWNIDPKPFVWKANAADIIEKASGAAPPSTTRSIQRQSTRSRFQSVSVVPMIQLLPHGMMNSRLVSVWWEGTSLSTSLVATVLRQREPSTGGALVDGTDEIGHHYSSVSRIGRDHQGGHSWQRRRQVDERRSLRWSRRRRGTVAQESPRVSHETVKV
jgi:transposase